MKSIHAKPMGGSGRATQTKVLQVALDDLSRESVLQEMETVARSGGQVSIDITAAVARKKKS